ncbi:MAG: glycosyltransferase family 9 protein [Nitrospirae bacterium]|nr:glycosyltransferase family 9 protein [Nitrospirota bacterium]
MQMIKWLRLQIDQFGLKLHSNDSGKGRARKRVGILRLDGMGDLILFLDALKGYRSFYPREKFEIYLIVEEWALPILKGIGDLDFVIPLDTRKFRKNPFYRWMKLREIREFEFDIFINGCIFRELLYGDILTYASASILRYGFLPQPDQKEERIYGNKCYTHLFPDPKWSVHELERNARLLREIGYKDFVVGMPTIKRYAGDLKENRTSFIVVPGARFKVRRWPIDRFAEIANRIYRRTGLIPTITGSASEQVLSEELINRAPELPWNNQTGSSIESLPELLLSAQFILTNDTGIMHYGMALGVRTAAMVYGGLFTSYSKYPVHLQKEILVIHDLKTDCFDCLGHCIYSNEKDKIKPCLDHVTVDQVFQAIEKWLPEKYSGEPSNPLAS